MKLLATLLPRIRRLVPSAERGLSVAVLGFLGALEFAGYHATTEFHDALAGTALIAVGLFVLAYHRTRPLAWVDAIRDRGMIVLDWFVQLKYDVGVDFRGEPPLPRKLPRGVPLTFLGLIAWTATAFAAWFYYPNGWRDFGANISYVLYVVALMTLWACLMVSVAAGVVIPVMILDARLRTGSSEPALGPPDAVVLVGYFLLIVMVSCVTPPVYAVSFCGLGLAVGLFGWLSGSRDSVAVLWRRGPGQPISAVPLRRLVALTLALASLAMGCVVAWSCGGRLFTSPTLEAGMPLTIFAGTVAAWLIPGLAAVLVYQWLDFRRSDPARMSTPEVHIDHSAGWGPIRRWGFAVARGARTRAHVGLRLVPESDSQAAEFQPDWPLKVSLADLGGTLVKERVARRDELQLRRQFFRSLGRIVKLAKKSAPSRGGGYLIAPQYWFITSVLWADPDHSPDASEDTLRPLGPSFRRAMPVRARQYMSRVLRATQVDAIYLEDGVSSKKLEKVLRAVLELHDMHGDRRKAEDHHFAGLPKVKVMIHSYEPGNPFQNDDYPEPKFDEVSRSRVLHVFKDRGDSEELADAPFDFSWEPAPLALR